MLKHPTNSTVNAQMLKGIMLFGFVVLLTATAASPVLPDDAELPVPVVSSITHFDEIPGVREFSGRLIARPIQPDALLAQGLSYAEAKERIATARRMIEDYEIVHYVPQTDLYVFKVPQDSHENEVVGQLMITGNFQYVEPDWFCYPIGLPNDYYYSSQWHHQPNRMQSADGWDIHTGNPTVGVGICDTGVRTTHEDLLLHRLEGYNAVDREWESHGGSIGPVHPHGTMTTGCAAANGNNSYGVAGVGWDLSHRMLRVSNSSGGGAYLSDLQHAAMTSIENGDRVANVSYSGCDSSSNLTTATYIKSIGGLLVWAAGNDGRNLTYGNRDADDMLVVGATEPNDSLAGFSAYGIFVDLTAPGVEVLTTYSDSDSSYAYGDGTSFAAPLAAGLCGLIFSADPGLTPDDVEDLLKQGCDDLGSSGVDNTYGYGRINVFGSLDLIAGGDPPVANFFGTPTSGMAPLTVDFTDTSTNDPTSWDWDFGDTGTSTDQHPSHVYTDPGLYTVTLTVTNAYGSDTIVRTDYIEVTGPPPNANFIGTPTSGMAPLTVDFTDTSANDPTSWDWDFGDTGTSTDQHPSHVYADPGLYTVTLTVTNAYGSDTLVRTDYIEVAGPPPVANFFGSPTSGVAPLTVDFTDTSTNDPTTWDWDFGDTGTSTDQHPSHVYYAPGLYTVTLTVTNAYGSDTIVRTDYITVDAPPPVITSLDPIYGPLSGDTPVIIYGDQFTTSADTVVMFNGVGATSVVVIDPNTITCNTPPNPAGPVDVTVTNSNGSDTLVDGFTYIPPPILTDITPLHGYFEGGTVVTLTGSYFLPSENTEVLFDGEPALNVLVVNATTITCETPPSPIPGVVDVELINSNGGALIANGFEYIPLAGADPLNLTDVDTMDLYPNDMVQHCVTGPAGALFMVFFSAGGGPTTTKYGIMGLDNPFYFGYSYTLNANGYHTLSFRVPGTSGYAEVYTHAIVDNDPPIWTLGGNNPNGTGSLKWVIH